MREWISVKDRLPEFESHILAIIPKNWDGSNEEGYFKPFSCDFDENMGFCDLWGYDNDRTYFPFNDRVTHWMPLPEPPKP